MPTERQILGCKIRAALEEFHEARKKPEGGGFLLPSRKERDEYLSEMFGMPPVEIRYFLTYSCKCDHPWSDGACDDCPQ